MKPNRIFSTVLCLSVFLVAGCHAWQQDTTLKGVTFKKARVEKDGLVIGLLEKDTIIGGRPCQRGWVQVHSNGVLAAFTASQAIKLERFTIPAGTWVAQKPDGVIRVCAFPSDTEVQGHSCRGGSGGPAGVQAAFYPSGRLKQYFLREDQTVQGVPCESGVFNQSIELHENGALKSCKLSQDFTREGHTHRRGDRIQLDEQGRIL